jgi:hypothetical protein
MTAIPRIADVHCTPLRFSPGDRILVTVHHRLDDDAKKKLRSSIQRWAGVPVEILIACDLDMEIKIDER